MHKSYETEEVATVRLSFFGSVVLSGFRSKLLSLKSMEEIDKLSYTSVYSK